MRPGETGDDMGLQRFIDWIETARPGESILYMQGANAEANQEARDLFWTAAKEGKVFLFQKRVRPGVFNYMARKLSPKAGYTLRPESWKSDA